MKRASLFDGFWKDMSGRRMRRLTHAEMAEVWAPLGEASGHSRGAGVVSAHESGFQAL